MYKCSQKIIKVDISGGDIPIPAEERGKPVATDEANVHSVGLDAMDDFEQPAREALDFEIRKEGRPKRKKNEKQIFVQLSDNNSDPEHMPQHHRRVSGSPSTLDHIDKVMIFSNRNVEGYRCGSFLLFRVHVMNTSEPRCVVKHCNVEYRLYRNLKISLFRACHLRMWVSAQANCDVNSLNRDSTCGS